MKTSFLHLLAAFLVAAFLCPQIQAFQLLMPLEQAVEQADSVLTGTVVSKQARFNSAGVIVTDVVIQVEATLKGAQLPESITLHFAGGKIDDQEMRVSGVPVLEDGVRYILLIKNDGETYATPITGGNQGLFEIRREPATGTDYVLTTQGRFLAQTNSGQIVHGEKAHLLDNGTFRKVQPQPIKDLPGEPIAEGTNVRVIRMRPIVSGQTDQTVQRLTLDDFTTILSGMIQAGQTH